MAQERDPVFLLWRFDWAVAAAGFRTAFASVVDVVLLIALLSASLFGFAYGIRYAASEQLPPQTAWLVLLGWPLAYFTMRSARRRLRWFEECTPLSAAALQSSARRAYLSLPSALADGLFLILVLIAAQKGGSRIGILALPSLCLLVGALQALAPGPRHAVARSYRQRMGLPPGHGRRLLVFAAVRSQLFGLSPRPVLLFALAAGLFCLAAAPFLLAEGSGAPIISAAIAIVALITFTRPDLHLSRCAPKIGFGPASVIIAHVALPLAIVLVTSAAAFTVAGLSVPFLAWTWFAWLSFSTLTILRALRYPRYSKQAAELRVLFDIVVLGLLGTAFLPLIIPGLIVIVGQAILAHRRMLWRLA